MAPEWIDVCPEADLPSGGMRRIEWEDLDIGVFNCAGSLYALEDRCSHDNGVLLDGEVDPTRCAVECPRHGSWFDLSTGKALNLPAYAPVDTFPVRVEAGVVQVEVE